MRSPPTLAAALLATALVTAVAVGPVPASAQAPSPPPIDPQAAAIRVAERVLLPGYDDLAGATAAQEDAWRTFCAGATPRDAATLDDAFDIAADAYARIEPVRYGPVAEDFRYERLAFWPERRDAAGRALAQLEGLPDESLLAPERFPDTSVAGQGFTAMERLLYEEDTRAALVEGGAREARLCTIGIAIAHALAETSGEIADAWRDEALPALVADAQEGRRAATRLATDLLSGLEAIETLKLGLPLGESLDDARASRAEMWRSGRSARQIALNLAGLEATARALVDEDAALAPDTLRYLAQAERLAAQGPADIGEAAADPERRGRVLLLSAAIATARTAAAGEIPPALGIVTGFNALDGD
ncbi:imelysin family protein [Salinarimonas ramus]|uniref:Signal peptidase n=1 Tax=Salinarimonas ramus TaxID=690164 RepID=A0A917Q7H6_9HYPH|nr:imelysin family protein [Salinarimonas ramus]GGK31878.1 signal peptidase [Salinarimonas ramus]